jgi:hypothetical protein
MITLSYGEAMDSYAALKQSSLLMSCDRSVIHKIPGNFSREIAWVIESIPL